MSRNLFLGITSRVLMIAVAALTLLSLVSMAVNPAKFWLSSVLGLCFVPLAVVNFILLLWAVKRRSKSFVIPLVALVPGLIFTGLYLRIPSSNEKTDKPDEPSLKIMTCNVGRFMLSDNGMSRQECMDSVFRFIEREQPDIVCLQEYYVRSGQPVRQTLPHSLRKYKAEYYLFSGKFGSYGNLTLSRIPISGKGKITFEESANLAIYTDYKAFGRKFRVYNCHFESYNISLNGLVRAAVKQEGDILAETGVKMKRSIRKRPKQVDKVLSDISNCTMESFVCGDFNDNPLSYTYYRLMKNRRDAFVEAGGGFGATYSHLWPLLRIDYVLMPESCRGTSYNVIKTCFSDHYPVMTTIRLPETGKKEQ